MSHRVQALLIAAGSLCCLGLSGPASAQPGPLVRVPIVGLAGGLCIGTAPDCVKKLTAPEGFDLLVVFELDSASLTAASRESLKAFAETLADERLATASFVVEGHSDARGDSAYNLGLSERRAKAVRDFLLECGVSPDKLGVAGLGESDPRTADPFDPANRRVEMRIRIR